MTNVPFLIQNIHISEKKNKQLNQSASVNFPASLLEFYTPLSLKNPLPNHHHHQRRRRSSVTAPEIRATLSQAWTLMKTKLQVFVRWFRLNFTSVSTCRHLKKKYHVDMNILTATRPVPVSQSDHSFLLLSPAFSQLSQSCFRTVCNVQRHCRLREPQ